MLRSVGFLRKELETRLRKEKICRNDEGFAVLKMNVRDDSSFLSDFSSNERAVISSEVAEFIERGARQFPPKERLCLQICSDCIDEKEKEIYSLAMREYFLQCYRENRLTMRRNLILSGILTLVGVLGLVIMFLLAHFWRNPVLSEVLDIFAWVFLWEAVDQFFLERSALRIKRNRYISLIHLHFEFVGLEQKES